MTADRLTSEAPRFRMGEGILVRRRGLVMLVGPGDEDATRELVEVARAASRGRQPGRQLAQTVARLLDGSAPPALCAAGTVNGGAAVLVSGAAALAVHTSDGMLSLRGSAAGLVERRVTGAVSAVRGALHAAALDAVGSLDPWCELVAGVARADAFLIGTHELPAADATDGVELDGVCCRAGHLNDPTQPYCGVCGVGLAQAGRLGGRRRRPALGVLVVDDGRVLPLDRDHVLGRAPDSPEVQAGVVTPVPLDDPLVADLHARISLDGWEVRIRDAESSHGTYLLDPRARGWQRLPSGHSEPLRPGAVIALGGRQLRFDTYRVA